MYMRTRKLQRIEAELRGMFRGVCDDAYQLADVLANRRARRS